MTTLRIQVSDQQAAALEAYVRGRGLTVEQWLLLLAEQSAPVSPGPAASDERPIWEIIAGSMKDVPPEIMATMPKDGASQHDHYIYGWPKREE